MMVPDSYPRGVPVSIKYPEMPVYSFLENSARKFPDRGATIYLGARLTYGQLWDLTLRFASGLQRLGVGEGDRVGVLLPNCPQFIIAYNAIQVAGGVVVTLSPLLPAAELSRELLETGCKVLITLDRLMDRLPEERPGNLVVAEAAYHAPLHLRILSRLRYRDLGVPGDAVSFEELTRGPPIEGLPEVDAREDVAVVLYTSGTTGQPKGVMLTHFSQVANALQSYHWLRGWGYSSKPQPAGWPLILCAVPFFHSYGLVVMNEAVSFGCILVLLPDPTAESIIKAIHGHRVTHTPLIPRMIREVLKHPDLHRHDLTSLTSVSSGGASIPVEDMKAFEEVTGARVYQGYGLTETGPSVCATPVEGAPNHASAGLPYPDTEVRILDIQLGEVEMPRGRNGEVVVRGPQLMKGYWGDPEATLEVLRDGWLFTGDIGHIDEQGYIYIVGRKRDKIVAEGHTVWPSEVEEVLASHPDVEAAIAIGAPDPLRCTTDIQAFVTLKGKADGMEEKLLEYCRSRLEHYQVPARVNVVASLPMTSMGKVDRLAVEAEIERRLQEQLGLA